MKEGKYGRSVATCLNTPSEVQEPRCWDIHEDRCSSLYIPVIPALIGALISRIQHDVDLEPGARGIASSAFLDKAFLRIAASPRFPRHLRSLASSGRVRTKHA